MFEVWKTHLKIWAFRGQNVQLESWEPDNGVIRLRRGWRRATLAVKLVRFDGKLQLAFSGDIIASDAKAIARVMKVMWNEELPRSMVTDELKAQLKEEKRAILWTKEGGETIFFRDMANSNMGMPNEVVTIIRSVTTIDE